MNPYLFGCGVLLAFWILSLLIVRRRKNAGNLREFWWASFSCALLGVTEFLFVPEYWSPPSILKIGKWDLESFIFCFAVGGITAAFPEVPAARRLFETISDALWRLRTRISVTVATWLMGGVPHAFTREASSVEVRRTRWEVVQDNMILVAAFLGAFGTTAHLHLNIIYDASITCIIMAVFIGWRRPHLRWQILSGGASFTAIYAVVLVTVGAVYPTFYTDYWNLPELSGEWILGAPAEEYLFALTLGLFWSPLYEAWKDVPTGP